MLQIHDIPKNYYQLQLSGQLMVVHFQKGGEKKEIITQKHAKPAKRQSQPIGSRLTRKILDSIADVSNCSATLLRKGI